VNSVKILIYIVFCLMTGCVTTSSTTYQQLGGYSKIEEIVDNFIIEIESDPVIFEYFKNSDVNRFREKLIEHICFLADGKCKYTGDTMEQVHDGMNISEYDFNRSVNLFINAMVRAKISHKDQANLLTAMESLRNKITYR